MKKLYTDLNNLPPSFIPKIVEHNPLFCYTNSVRECDYVLMPFWEVVFEYTDYQYNTHDLDPGVREVVRRSVEILQKEASDHDKPLIVFNWSDNEAPIPVDNAIFFRTSLYKSNQQTNEFALPSWKEDLVQDYNKGVLEIRKKPTHPSVGFRGSSRPLGFSFFDLYRYNMNFVNRLFSSMELSFVSRHQWNPGQILRKKAMINLMRNRHIRTDFKVVTRGYINQRNAGRKLHNRYKFVENMFNNDYNICVRGAGNYSYRFYETISTGRIPLFINTDCVLPLDFDIDWKKYCVWVEETDIKKIDQILLDFHNDLSNDDFEELQVNIRKLWEEKLGPKAFYGNIEQHLDRVPIYKSIV